MCLFTVDLVDGDRHRLNGNARCRVVLAVGEEQRLVEQVTLDSASAIKRTAKRWAADHDLDAKAIEIRLRGLALTVIAEADEYVADLETAKRSPVYCCNVEKRMAKLFATCNWHNLADVDPNGFIAWRIERGRMDAAPRTLNQYLETARGFLGWCVRNNRLATDPRSCVSKVDARGDIRRRRRGLAPDKLDALLAVSEQRALCYLTVTYTLQLHKNPGHERAF